MSIKLKTLSVILLAVLISCALQPVIITVPRDYETKTIEENKKIPLRVGLYLNQQYQNYRLGGQQLVNEIVVGKALSDTTKMMLRNIFRDVVVIDYMTGDLSATNLDVIITPELVSLIPMPEGSVVYNKITTKMVIKWTIVSLDGKTVYLNTIEGVGATIFYKGFSTEKRNEYRRDGVVLAMKDQFQKAQEDIYSNGWWKKQWWKDGN